MIEVIHALAEDVPADLLASCDALICDPPYSEHVHANAMTNHTYRVPEKRDLGFSHLTPELLEAIAKAAALIRGWSCVFSDFESTHLWRDAATKAGAEYVRTVPWIRWSQPQITGDRPGSGREEISLFHHGGAKVWGGPGSLLYFDDRPDSLAYFDAKALRGGEKFACEKPLDLMLALVSYFSAPRDTVIDLTGGSGTTGLACRILERDCVIIERDAATCTLAERRCTQPLTKRDRERVARWVAAQREWTAKDEPDSVKGRARYARARADTELAARTLG